MIKTTLNSPDLSKIAIAALQDIKGLDIVRLDLRKIDTAVTDFFVIASGTSDRHVSSLGDNVIMRMKKVARDVPINREGLQTGSWVLLDYGSIVVHIFQQEARDFYTLESLWGDAKAESFDLDSGE